MIIGFPIVLIALVLFLLTCFALAVAGTLLCDWLWERNNTERKL